MDAGAREQAHVRASIVECSKESRRALGAYPETLLGWRWKGKGGKHLLSPSLKCFRVAGTKTRLFIRRGARRRRARRPRPISIASQFIDRMRSSNFSRC